MAEISLFQASGLFPNSTSSTSISTVLTTDTNTVAGDISASDGSEVLFNLCNHMNSVVSNGTATKVRTSTGTNLSGTTLTKTYTFTFDLDFQDVGDLNVQDEPA